MTSRAHWPLVVSTRRTPFSSRTAVARCTFEPTAAFQASSTLPDDIGEPRNSSVTAPRIALWTGFIRRPRTLNLEPRTRTLEPEPGTWNQNRELGTGNREPYYRAMRLVLASASPRRAELLTAAGFRFETLAVDVDERVQEGEAPERAARRLAGAKSAAAAALTGDPDALILGADTLVVVDELVLGKPKDEADATQMLTRLAGRHHEVATGVSLRRAGREIGTVELTTVFFAPMSIDEINWYVQTGEGRDKAGAYAIQGLGSRFVERIAGSYSNVVGLPVSVAYRLIRELASGGNSELF